MKFCALTKKEVEIFQAILDNADINYEIDIDHDAVEANDESMKFNLRHLNTPSISTAILSIEVEDSFWSSLDHLSLDRLSQIGIYQVEEGENVLLSLPLEEKRQCLRSVLNKGHKRLVGVHFLIYFVLIGVLTFLVRYLNWD